MKRVFPATAARQIAVRLVRVPIAKASTAKAARDAKLAKGASLCAANIARPSVQTAIVTATAVIATAEMMEDDENDYTRTGFNR